MGIFHFPHSYTKRKLSTNYVVLVIIIGRSFIWRRFLKFYNTATEGDSIEMSVVENHQSPGVCQNRSRKATKKLSRWSACGPKIDPWTSWVAALGSSSRSRDITWFLQAALILRVRSCLQMLVCSTCATAAGRPVYPAGTGRPVFWEGVWASVPTLPEEPG